MPPFPHSSAVAWAREALLAARRPLVSEPEVVRERPWGTVLRLPTDAGPVWLKLGSAETGFEAGLYAVLTARARERVLAPLALEASRGWLLLPDGGPALRQTHTGDGLHAALADAFARYAELQRALSGCEEELLALGLADMRPAGLPARFEEARAVIPESAPLAELRGEVARWCAELAARPGGASVDHNDLHAGNILAGGRFYDWGDAVLAHPFASLLVGLSAAHRELGASGPQLARLRDAYLEPWADLASHAELVTTLELAGHTAKITRALVWIRALGPEPAGRFAGAPRACLEALRRETNLGVR